MVTSTLIAASTWDNCDYFVEVLHSMAREKNEEHISSKVHDILPSEWRQSYIKTWKQANVKVLAEEYVC